jgi:hypothetical protein
MRRNNARIFDDGDAVKWAGLDDQGDPCAVVTRRMEVVYLNPAAQSLVPEAWPGRRCWEVFPVGAAACASRCPAVRAVTAADEIELCEETIFPGGDPVLLGVAVIPVGPPESESYRAMLLLRPRPADSAPDQFRARLLEDASRLRRQFSGCA